MVPIVLGPEDPESGDPLWIEPEYAEGGAHTGDGLIAYGRWKARYFPTDRHLADDHAFTMGRVGLRAAMTRLAEAVGRVREAMADGPVAPPGPDEPVNDDPIVQMIVAVYDALEWIHSLDEHLRQDGAYKRATEKDPVIGAFVEGAIGARNASHHGLRRVVGAVRVPASAYVAVRDRWVLDDRHGLEREIVQVRWVEKLPLRTEAKHAGTDSALRIPEQEGAYEQHLAGREVQNTLLTCWVFFRFTVMGEPVPPGIFITPGLYPPNIDPTMLDRVPYAVRYKHDGESVQVYVPGVGSTRVERLDEVEPAARALIADRFHLPPESVLVRAVEGMTSL